jgi:hypothetical protein
MSSRICWARKDGYAAKADARVVWQANMLSYAFLAIAGCILLWRELSESAR